MAITVSYGRQPTGIVKLKAPWGWFHIPHPNPSVMEIHIMPANDIGRHAFDLQCACRPHEDPQAPGFVIHCAFDGREAYERGARKCH